MKKHLALIFTATLSLSVAVGAPFSASFQKGSAVERRTCSESRIIVATFLRMS
ncbi:MAG TPA: hypothetical protein VIC84_17940 [Blastocatellia bacterium]|jgi:hypothetical protein